MIYAIAKRGIDIAVSSVALLALAPPLGVVSLLVRLKIGSPVFFRQQRPGLRGRPFELVKFRTMRGDRDSAGKLLSDEERLTAFGSLLRKTSLDELPELWNVLRGDMSLVGPRPLLMQYLPRYSRRQGRRHEVRPGVTGWAQVNGRNALSWDERFELDVWYVEHASLWLDLKIIYKTFAVVFWRQGVSANDHVTMPEFMGTSGDR